ncbi:GyrI-like domain-containing protein [Paenibacillus allorhizosphaerae]|uniref:AraC effector-binding domain-containing protein n=1 Tax=Paenibacillus allorhizosphaerae TaxID=2849866 RepID=A0ABN7TQC8_9BACL|nr:GyrI-like domain-containing protein [Paenibacillus allorhizosphaerae]CAG7646157.1 hypothetical protein PAECIP111802_03672 [Paenibacillus allorhizosphaerae]
MAEQTSIHDLMQVTTVTVGPIRLVGLRGIELEDQHSLFQQMKQRKSEIQSRMNDHEYLVILPRVVPFVALEVTGSDAVPHGMVSQDIPEERYAVFRFEEKFIGKFWGSICSNENQLKYNIDLSKPRFEIFLPDLQPEGITEWYIPLKNGA